MEERHDNEKGFFVDGVLKENTKCTHEIYRHKKTWDHIIVSWKISPFSLAQCFSRTYRDLNILNHFLKTAKFWGNTGAEPDAIKRYILQIIFRFCKMRVDSALPKAHDMSRHFLWI